MTNTHLPNKMKKLASEYNQKRVFFDPNTLLKLKFLKYLPIIVIKGIRQNREVLFATYYQKKR